MVPLLWSIAILLAADVILITVVFIQRFSNSTSTASILEISPLIVAAGVMIALLTFLITSHRSRSEDFLKVATDRCEKAYETFCPDQGADLLPNYRQAWLNVARIISTAEKVGARITQKSHRLIFREIREYWRARFFDSICPSVEGLPSSYYAEEPSHMNAYMGGDRPPIDEKSLAFMYRFVRWPENVEDPISSEPTFTDEEINRMCTFGRRGLGNLMT